MPPHLQWTWVCSSCQHILCLGTRQGVGCQCGRQFLWLGCCQLGHVLLQASDDEGAIAGQILITLVQHEQQWITCHNKLLEQIVFWFCQVPCDKEQHQITGTPAQTTAIQNPQHWLVFGGVGMGGGLLHPSDWNFLQRQPLRALELLWRCQQVHHCGFAAGFATQHSNANRLSIALLR